jgi:hypothetical protein
MSATEIHLAIVPVDEAWRRVEQTWGVGRLERIVSPEGRAALQRGIQSYNDAITDRDAARIASIGARLVKLLATLDAEARALGHQPIDPSCWEAPLADGSVLVVCRSTAEASAVSRAAVKGEGTLPPDLALAIRATHEGRALQVWTMAEVARMIDAVGSPVSAIKREFPEARITGGISWEGSPAPSGVRGDELLAHDAVRYGTDWVDTEFPAASVEAVPPPLPAIILHSPCPGCEGIRYRTGPGKGPHRAELICDTCGRGGKWLSNRQAADLTAETEGEP